MINYKRSESTEQIAVIQWCNYNSYMHPELQLMFHIPNGGKRSKTEAIRLKQEGVKAGVPDLCLPVARRGYHGLFIEMKYGKNKTTENQRQWLKELSNQGYFCKVCNGAEEAVQTINTYLKD